MRTRDSALIAGTFAPGTRLVSAGTRKGTLMIDPISAEEFAGVVAKATGPTWDERVLGMTIQFDASPEGWKIIALSDTQRREGCAAGK
jgi:hypothetical protein